MSKKMTLAALATFSLIAGCESFTDVSIPAHDAIAPTALPTLYEDGAHVYASPQTSSNAGESYVVVATAMDGGGAHRVTLVRHGKATCDLGGGIHQASFIHYAPIEATRVGDVGDTVSNGLYVVDVVKPGQYACSQGVLIRGEYTWSVEAEDFHGNESVTDGGTLVYEK